MIFFAQGVFKGRWDATITYQEHSRQKSGRGLLLQSGLGRFTVGNSLGGELADLHRAGRFETRTSDGTVAAH